MESPLKYDDKRVTYTSDFRTASLFILPWLSAMRVGPIPAFSWKLEATSSQSVSSCLQQTVASVTQIGM